jgi:16S rRNA (guanine966-N2)-methyltransferase
VATQEGLRPTPDRVRETIFNWLAPVIEGARCLDLYAGTGALGFEALSRGAEHAVFVERNASLVAGLRRTARELGACCTIHESAAKDFLHQTAERFDVVFLDPPYDTDLGPVCAVILAERLRLGGMIYVERPSHAELTGLASAGRLLKSSRAGGVHFGLLVPVAAHCA